MKINPFIFRNYDIRGKIPDDLDKDKVFAIGKGYAKLLLRRKIRHCVVGYDCRLTGPEFKEAFVKALTSSGINVIDIGMVMTQMVYYGQYRFQTNGGAMITASHNPQNFNGFKLAIGFSQTTGPDEVKEIKDSVDSDDFINAEVPGTYTTADIKEDYFNDVLKRVNITKKFKIVVDSHNGTTGMYVPELIRRTGCEVIERMTEVDGHFPNGTPDPTDAHIIMDLAKVVLEQKADLGVAFDGDGDRIGIVDEKGHILWNDVFVAIFAKEILERFPKSKIVYNTLCSQVVDQVVRASGGVPILWRTGHSFIKKKIAEEGAAFGGELSGHFFFADNAYGHDDGSYAILRMLEYLEAKGLTLSQLYESFPSFISSPEIKIGCPDDKKIVIVKDLSIKFKKDFANARITDDTVIPGDDGIRADFEDGMMVFRYSQNGPYITIKFEAKDQAIYDERKKYISDVLHSYPEMIWTDELCVNLDSLE